jgi:hypothetical protein
MENKNNQLKFRAWNGKELKQVDQITIGEKAWTCENGYGVSIPYQPHIILLQFIELTDKNGVEIYDGDILEDKSRKWKYNVFKVKGGFAINTHQNDFNRTTPFYTAFDMQTTSYINGNCEVTGNIYGATLTS